MPSVLAPTPGPHPPGSFTKNYGWSGKGFLLLHSAIRAGFSGKLTAVERRAWRDASQLDPTKFVLTANFFLHNVQDGQRNIVPVDEFVRQAVMEPHSQAFDRLALFVLNLSLGGKRAGSSNGVEFPSAWANQFVRQELWQAGRWQTQSLENPVIDSFFSAHIVGEDDVKIKCRNNYRHMFELVKYWPTANPVINTYEEDWISAALFTAWDRRALALRSPTVALSPELLVSTSEQAEDFKLIGLTIDEFRMLAGPIAEQYAAAGGINRFIGSGLIASIGVAGPGLGKATIVSEDPPTLEGKSEPPGPATATDVPGTIISPGDLGWLIVAASDAAVDRELSHRLAQKRNRLLAVKLKALYDYKCMACDTALIVGLDPERRHAECAHIKPLGLPHNGPDKPGNMIVLCPGHHIQFDRGILSLRATKRGTEFVSRIKGDPVHQRVVQLHTAHQLDQNCVNWHATMFLGAGE